MTDNYQIHLNFIPFVGPLPNVVVHRRVREANETKADHETRGFNLPVTQGGEEYRQYWIRLTPSEGWEPFQCDPECNRHLFIWILYDSLRHKLSRCLSPEQFDPSYDRFLQEIAIVMKSHNEGNELLLLQPYYLAERRQFGLLVDFHFKLNKDSAFSIRVQQLSLSLNSSGKRNVDYYLDRTQKLSRFMRSSRMHLTPLTLPGSIQPVTLADEFCPLSASQLQQKTYIFSGGRGSRGQFNGLKEHGPLTPVQLSPRLLFAFREQDRHVARTLAQALKGPRKADRFGFPGFEALFRSSLEIDGNPIILKDFSEGEFQRALRRVQEERAINPAVLPVFVLPEGDDNGYMDQKAIFSHAGIPTQVCTLPVIHDDYSLKWAIGNIALQIFCKAGGHPWKVRPTSEQSLIIGISQSHKVRDSESGDSWRSTLHSAS